ncbi:hypothetical protein HID58_095341 [Brassica napus]|uniref:Uncharacterized protein n=1 Tax=Brassica napus TaxID=3708 RepID=A0ABQ7X6D0_BRANA|nr:hypothetical protein HID58_095341 [Brassica napus]
MKSEAIQPPPLDLPERIFSLPVKKLWGFRMSEALCRASLVKLSAVASLVKLFVAAPPVKLSAAAPLMKPSAAASPVKFICRCIST